MDVDNFLYKTHPENQIKLIPYWTELNKPPSVI